MKKIYLIALLVAVLCGALVFSYINTTEDRIAKLSEEKKIKLESVVVAKQDIPPFTPITAEMVTTKQYPAEYIHESAAKSVDEVLGLMANGTIVKGETILLTAVGNLDDIGQSLSYKIPDGMRAMTISVDSISGVGGYITKGDLVDILVYVVTDGYTDKIYPADLAKAKKDKDKYREIPGGAVKRVISAAEVLRVGSVGFVNDGSSVYSSLTLALTPEDCEVLLAAMNQGGLYINLRQKEDDSAADQKIYTATPLLK